MFHYSLVALTSRSRMLIALLLAIALHIGLMNFEFDRKQIFVPDVSLPRSVSVFLGQGKMTETALLQEERAQTSEHALREQQAAETEPEKPVQQKSSEIKEETDIPLPQSALFEKTARQPVAETTRSAGQSAEYSEKGLLPAPGETAKVQGSATPAEPPAVRENEDAALPGTLQMAYPRYQLNAPPAYPGRARKRGQEGTVILQVLVNAKGMVDDLEIEKSSGVGSLDRAAAASVRKWSFEPGRRGEEKVPMWVRVPITFKLKK